ncbi:hypothetical protein GYA25_03535 [Candidatus Woesearchaeota archaeon]|nr:hypothetical protein [Candidatus Woesearchaeota archaeon]
MTSQAQTKKLPEGWKKDKLGDVAEIFDNKRIPLSEIERAKINGPYPYCGANGIIDHINKFIFDGEYVLLAEDGGDFKRFGNSAYLMNGKFWVNNHAHVLKAIEGEITNQYLLIILNYLDLNQYVVGSTRKKLNQEQLREILIPLPPLPEQRAIATILSEVDRALENIEKEIQATERLKKGLMAKLLENPNWKKVKFCTICNKIQSGGTPLTSNKEFYDGEIPFVKIEDITNSGKYINKTEIKISEKGLENSNAWLIPENNLLLAIYGSLGKVTINKIPLTTNQAILGIILNNNLANTEFYYYYFNYLDLQRYAKKSTQANLTAEIIKNLDIPLPPLPEQQRIAEILSTIDKKIELEQKKKEKMERIKKGLMNDLLTGNKRVNVENVLKIGGEK